MLAVLDRNGNCLALLQETEKSETALEGWLLGKKIVRVNDLAELQEAMFLPSLVVVCPKIASHDRQPFVNKKNLRQILGLK